MSKKEDILLAGAKLFADRSFHAVGIRDIADRAKANSSMISYYYGGKCGLLLCIIQRFIDLYLDALTKAIEESPTRESFPANLARRLITSARSNRRMYMVGLKELYAQDDRHILELKERFEEERWERLSSFFGKNGAMPERSKTEREIIFKATTAMIFSDYLIGDGVMVDDDEKVELYIKVVADLILRGVPRKNALAQAGRSPECSPGAPEDAAAAG